MEHNWAGNITYRAARFHQPETVEQVQEIVQASRKVRALGSRHSFNRIADTAEDLVSLASLNRIISFDSARRTVTVQAGVKYGQLGEPLHQAGYALPNMASLPHISVAGACATGTHGSGVGNSNLATSVSAMQLVTAEGELVEVSRAADGGQFQGMVVALGGVGIVTRMTLDLLPTFTVRQDLYENLPIAHVQDNLEDIISSGYSVSLFTTWRAPHFEQVWVKSHVRDDSAFAFGSDFFGAAPAQAPLHPIATMDAANCTEQLGVPGPWHERLPHFRMGFTPSSGQELQTEYFVARENGVAAIEAIAGIRKQIAPLVQISEVRTIAADTLWMSPSYNRASIAIHFTWVNDWDAVQPVLPLIEARLAPFQARPHWGKLSTMPPAQVQALYERLPDFRQLLTTYDPQGKFRNPFLDTYIFGT